MRIRIRWSTTRRRGIETRRFRWFAAAVVLLGSTQAGYGLRFEQLGPLEPGRGAHAQPGWPAGIGPIAAHGSRVYSVGGAGAEEFYFKSSPEQIAELIKGYCGLRIRDFQIFIKKGEPTVQSFGGKKIGYNVHFHLLEGRGLAQTRAQGGAQTFDPTLTIHVRPGADLEPFKLLPVPEYVVLKSEFDGWPQRKEALPERKLWYAKILFENGKPASEPRIWTTVTLWERDEEHGINLGEISYKEGLLKAALSADEIASLRGGNSWMTLTVGNSFVKVKRDDPQLPFERLVLDSDKTKPVTVSKPAVHYYGRILFDDGSPAILDPLPWPSAEIMVDFPFAGPAHPDKDGWFKVYFTAKQFESARARQLRKNIYIPDVNQANHSQALWIFPVGELSPDKAKAGKIRIPNPMEKKGN